MKGREKVYLLAVLVTSAALSWNAFDLAVQGGPGGAHAWHPGAGRPRAVDVERLRERIREGHLSDHPALFAHPADR